MDFKEIINKIFFIVVLILISPILILLIPIIFVLGLVFFMFPLEKSNVILFGFLLLYFQNNLVFGQYTTFFLAAICVLIIIFSSRTTTLAVIVGYLIGKIMILYFTITIPWMATFFPETFVVYYKKYIEIFFSIVFLYFIYRILCLIFKHWKITLGIIFLLVLIIFIF